MAHSLDLLTIVVPTRNRAPYLRHCLQTCLAAEDTNIEVIVSDNNSTDDTAQVVASFSDPRLHYVNTGADFSMRQNFEFALSHARGDYIIFIGDDDGILKNGLATLRRVIEKYRPDVVNWRHITYKWPDGQRDSILKFRYKDFFGPLYREDPRKVLTSFCAAELTSFRDAAHIYHGAVSSRLVDRIRTKSGGYFMGQIPDVYTALANLVCADSFFWMRNPVSIGGESPKSNGAATTTVGKQTAEQKDIARSFVDLAARDSIQPEVDLRLRPIPSYVYACLVRINALLADGKLDIDHAAWRKTLMDEIADMDPALRREQAAMLHTLFAQADPSFTFPPQELARKEDTGTTDVAAVVPAAQETPRGLRADLVTVEDARRWIDAVTGGSYLPARSLPIAFLSQFGHMAGMRRRRNRPGHGEKTGKTAC